MSWAETTDFLEDLHQISDFRTKVTMPVRQISVPSKRVHCVRPQPSIYDFEDTYVSQDSDYDSNHNISPHSDTGHSARGRGSFTRRPRSVNSFLEKQAETFKYIREVSGLGYSNDMIEHNLRGTITNDGNNSIDMTHIKVGSSTAASSSSSINSPSKSVQFHTDGTADMPNIKLQPSPGSSARSTPTNVSTMFMKSSDSPTPLEHAPTTTVKALRNRPISKTATSTPSLFDIINSASNAVPPDKLSATTTIQDNAYLLATVADKSKCEFLDINSEIQFPPL